MNRHKRKAAIDLALLLTLSPAMNIYVSAASAAGISKTQEEETVTTGTQEAAKEKEADKKQEASENDEYADDEDTQEAAAEPVEWEDIQINSTADLVALSRSCWLDTWSKNKRVCLNCDLKLANSEFVSIPTFGGYFDGQGHTIEGLCVDDAVSYTGLFCYVQENAVITDLTVKGTVQPSGEQTAVGGIAGDNSGTIQNCKFDGIVEGSDYTGGIAGFNELTGSLVACTCSGYVTGTHYTGGIVGENMGNIMRCINTAEVNSSNVDKGMSLDDINLEQYTSNLFNLDAAGNDTDASEVVNSTVDTGGIAGQSIGVIRYSTNYGVVGYEHVGYNVGGIAGRQSGYIYECNNEGIIYGRKDVGGITGQAEPYIVVDFSKDVVYQLSENINKLHDLIDQTLQDAGSESDTISNRLSVLQSFADKALDDTSYLSDKTVEWTDGVIAAANEAVGRAEYIMDEASKDDGLLDQSEDAAENVKSAAGKLSEVVDDLDIYQYMSDAEKEQYDRDKSSLESATSEHAAYAEDAYNAYEDYYLDEIRSSEDKYKDPSLSVNEIDLRPVVSGNTVTDWTWNSSNTYQNYMDVEDWVHHTASDGDKTFPDPDTGEQNTLDNELLADTQSAMESNAATVESDAASYADSQYLTSHGSVYTTDIESYVDGMAGIVLAHTGEMSDSAKEDAGSAASYAKSASENLKSASGEAKDIVSTVAGESDIELPQLGSEYRQKTNSLASNLQGMSDNMGYLNSEMNTASDVLLADFEAVNDQFNVIMLLYTDSIDGVLDMDYTASYEDDSNEVAQECTDATIAECTNNGEVNGDIDASGIAGTMAIEYDFDLESDETGIKDAKANSTYRAKCVMRKDKNNGTVTAQKSYAGGVTGLQEMGTILLCENYGRIVSNAGDYVGGVAGQSLSYIQKSYAKCSLSGGTYVAGITGSGTNITDCYAMVHVSEAEAFFGAIAGEITEDGQVHHNLFVGSDLAGIDRISYSGKAEPVSYEALLEKSDVPAGFRKLTITFYCDDAVIKKEDCRYGDSIPDSDYPQIQEKEGYYVDWDIDDLSNVTFDQDVTAQYMRYLTTLAGSQTRGNRQSDLLVDGTFEEGDELHATLYSTSSLPMKNVLEHWKLEFPEDGNAQHLLRYQAPDNQTEDVEIYVKNGETWGKEETETMGSYQIFTIDGTAAEIAIVSKTKSLTDYIWIAAVVCGAVTVMIIYSNKKKKHKKKKKNGKTLEEIEI